MFGGIVFEHRNACTFVGPELIQKAIDGFVETSIQDHLKWINRVPVRQFLEGTKIILGQDLSVGLGYS